MAHLIDTLDIYIFNTREAKDEIALTQLGAAAILFWDHIPDDVQANLLHAAETVTGVQTIPDAHSRLQRLIKSNAPINGK